MSLRRKDLEAMEIPAEKIGVIIEAHMETVNALKEERDTYKAKAEKADGLEKELEKAKKQIEDSNADDLQAKLEKLEKEYKDYKQSVADEKDREAKVKAFKEILQDIGITDEKNIAKVIKYSDVSKMELDDDGKLANAKDIAKETKTEWAELITTEGTKGAEVSNPSGTNGNKSSMTKEEILAIKDTAERQKAMTENHELFGI